MKIRKALKRFFTEETAATTVEYAIMLALIALVAFKSMQVLGGQAAGVWFDSATALTEKEFGK